MLQQYICSLVKDLEDLRTLGVLRSIWVVEDVGRKKK